MAAAVVCADARSVVHAEIKDDPCETALVMSSFFGAGELRRERQLGLTIKPWRREISSS